MDWGVRDHRPEVQMRARQEPSRLLGGREPLLAHYGAQDGCSAVVRGSRLQMQGVQAAMTPFPYRVEQDEHAVWHIRKLRGGECVACVDAATMEILRGWFALEEKAR